MGWELVTWGIDEETSERGSVGEGTDGWITSAGKEMGTGVGTIVRTSIGTTNLGKNIGTSSEEFSR